MTNPFFMNFLCPLSTILNKNMYKHLLLYESSRQERHRQNLPEAPFLPAAAFGMPPVFLFSQKI
jgi:hypothetical protein